MKMFFFCCACKCKYLLCSNKLILGVIVYAIEKINSECAQWLLNSTESEMFQAISFIVKMLRGLRAARNACI